MPFVHMYRHARIISEYVNHNNAVKGVSRTPPRGSCSGGTVDRQPARSRGYCSAIDAGKYMRHSAYWPSRSLRSMA
jgi:hypothetical protein